MSIQDCISATVAYYQVFNYFLNAEELHEYLHTNVPVAKTFSTEELRSSHRLVNGYVISNLEAEKGTPRRRHLRQHEIKVQQIKLAASLKKFKIAEYIATILKRIPTIKLIAVSGNLAMMNAGAPDDIDFFIVTRSGATWTTRFLASIILILLGKKRLYGAREVKDKICLNFFVDENRLEMKKKNLYVAHEITQMKVLYDRGGIYHQILEKNFWVKNFLANWWENHGVFVNQENLFEEIERNEIGEKIASMFFIVVEPIFRFFQLQYMKRKITREILKPGLLMFHPRDYGREIMRKYKVILRCHSRESGNL